MTILIKGMEMPETCYKCKFALARFDPLPTQKYKRHDFECVLTEKTLTSTKRNRACPLVPVPTPHGRLIDADKLMKVVYSELSYGEEALWAMVFCDGFIGPAPTVIEAEEVNNGD